MPELPLGSALLSLVPEEEKGQGASSPLPPDFGDTSTPRPRACGRMPGQEDDLAAGCLGMAAVGAAPEHPGAVQGLALGDTVGTPGLGRDRWVTRAGWAGGRVGSWMCSVTVQLLKSADLGRQSLLYLKEIGHGWFGKVSSRGRVPRGHPGGMLAVGPGLCKTGFGVRMGCVVRTEGTSLSLAPGVPGGGELGHQQHPGGGEGAEGERQRAGPDAVPGGSAALQVHLGSLRGAAAALGTAGSRGAVGWCLVPSVPRLATEQSHGCPVEVPGQALRAARLSWPHRLSAWDSLQRGKGCAGSR